MEFVIVIAFKNYGELKMFKLQKKKVLTNKVMINSIEKTDQISF